jgi:hypothetical protein
MKFWRGSWNLTLRASRRVEPGLLDASLHLLC